MLALSFDFSALERKAKELGSAIDQVPFALANAMKAAAFKVRETLINDTWPQHVEVRNRNALRSARQVQMAKKKNLSVSIAGRGHRRSG